MRWVHYCCNFINKGVETPCVNMSDSWHVVQGGFWPGRLTSGPLFFPITLYRKGDRVCLFENRKEIANTWRIPCENAILLFLALSPFNSIVPFCPEQLSSPFPLVLFWITLTHFPDSYKISFPLKDPGQHGDPSPGKWPGKCSSTWRMSELCLRMRSSCTYPSIVLYRNSQSATPVFIPWLSLRGIKDGKVLGRLRMRQMDRGEGRENSDHQTAGFY